MNFRISGLDYAQFASLFEMTDDQLLARRIVRRVADSHPGFPCRVSLQDAQFGETLLLMNYEHLPAESPYRSRHAIYVRQNARNADLSVNEIPEVMRRRLLSLRAFDQEGMMLDAEVTPGQEASVIIQRMLANEDVAFIHAHNARQGCFAARIDRAE